MNGRPMSPLSSQKRTNTVPITHATAAWVMRSSRQDPYVSAVSRAALACSYALRRRLRYWSTFSLRSRRSVRSARTCFRTSLTSAARSSEDVPVSAPPVGGTAATSPSVRRQRPRSSVLSNTSCQLHGRPAGSIAGDQADSHHQPRPGGLSFCAHRRRTQSVTMGTWVTPGSDHRGDTC